MRTEKGRPGLRRDAARNRKLLIGAADEVLREQGLDAPLDEIARRAGVGNATLYRHFPTRERLYEAVFAEAVEMFEQVHDQISRIADPWTGFATFFEETCAFIATDQGLCDLMTQGMMPRSPVLNELRMRADTLMQTLLDRAQEQGVVRADIQLTDVLFIMCSLLRVIPASAAICPDAWRRHLAITLDGLRPRDGAALPSAALTYEQMLELGDHFKERRLGSGLTG